MNKYLKEIISIIFIIMLVLLFKRFIMMPVKVSGDSMMDTLNNNDIMILNRFSKYFNGYKRFDIVVVKSNNSYIIKRVIGLPGEEVVYKDNKLFINDKYLKEEYLNKDISTNDFSVKVPKDFYFLMGDNREVSYDSRELGPFSKNDIMGKANFVIFPFNRFGTKK